MNDIDENDNTTIIHFVGYWKEPSEAKFETDESLGLQEYIDDLELLLTPPEVVEHYNQIMQLNGAFNNGSLN